MVFWVVHRRDEERAWLAELVPRRAAVNVGVPRTEAFREAPEPRAVVLGLEGDCSEELQFANDICNRFPRARWWLAGEPHESGFAARLFDCLPHEFLDLSAASAELRSALETGQLAANGPSLSDLRERSALSDRFRELFSDLDPNLFLPLVNPAEAAAEVLIEGESGTGKRLLARYVHAVTEQAPGPCCEIDARELRDIEELWARLRRVPAEPGDAVLAVILLHTDALPETTQSALASRLELGYLPSNLPRVRVFALCGDSGRDVTSELRHRFRHQVRIPPLRERPGAVERFVRAFAEERGAPDEATVARWVTALSQRRLRRNYRDLERLLERAAPAGDGVSRDAPEPGEARDGGEDSTAPAPQGVDIDAISHALAHELRNPLSTLQTFTTLFPEQHQDEEFRVNFGSLASEDVARMTRTMELLERYNALRDAPTPKDAIVCDLATLAEAAVREFRDTVDARKIVVLEELERGATPVQAPASHVAFALRAVLSQVIDWVEDGRDLYLSVRRSVVRGDEAPSVRLLLRFPGISDRLGAGDLAPARASLALTLADAVFASAGGTLTLDTETTLGLLAIDLPAAS